MEKPQITLTTVIDKNRSIIATNPVNRRVKSPDTGDEFSKPFYMTDYDTRAKSPLR